MKRILVTGAAGFIGRSLVRALKEKGFEVRCLIRRQGLEKAQRALGDISAEFWGGDLTDAESLRGIAADIDTVFHLASIGDLNAPDSYYPAYCRVNVEGTENLIRECLGLGVGRFVYFSSLAAIEYPLTPYGRTKAAAEKAVRASGMPFAVIRFPMVWDTEEYGEFKKIACLIRLGVIPVIGKRKFRLRNLHRGTLVSASINCISCPLRQCVATFESAPLEMLELLGKISGGPRGASLVPLAIPAWGAYPIVWLFEKLSQLFNVMPFLTVKRLRYLMTR